MSRVVTALIFLPATVSLLLGGCGKRDRPTPVDPAAATAVQPSPPPSRAPSRERGPRIVFLGDSLTAGFGLEEAQAFPAIIGRSLEELGIQTGIVNAGVSGDTSAGGLSRIDWLLRQDPDIVVVGLGANDGLRGLSVQMTEANLRQILLRIVATGARPLLLGLKLPPNLGADYIERFEAIYPRLAEELDIPLVPFMLDGVAGVPKLNLPDGIHPTAEGQERVAENILPWVEKALRDLPEE